VARDLGVPCVINTHDGTRRIPEGARVRIDGDAGTVTLLAPTATGDATEGSER
jgi:pyruvate,water dikinase